MAFSQMECREGVAEIVWSVPRQPVAPEHLGKYPARLVFVDQLTPAA